MFLYCGIVFGAGFAIGPVRVLLLEPNFGPLISVLCEAPLLLAAMVFGARWVPGVVGLRRGWLALLMMGIGALVLQQGADLGVGLYLRGMTLREVFAQFATPEGKIYLGLLAAFALMPLVVNRRR